MSKVKSDGGSSSYYQVDIPIGKTTVLYDDSGEADTIRIEVKDIIKYALDNDFDRGNIFKALVRLDKKEGADREYDINKCQFFLQEIRNG